MKRVLLVEDDVIIALDLAQQLAGRGYSVIGPARDCTSGLRLVDAPGCDVAVLDINLGAETSEAVALALIDRGIPFVTVSGYTLDQRSSVFNNAPLLGKPTKFDQLTAVLDQLLIAR